MTRPWKAPYHYKIYGFVQRGLLHIYSSQFTGSNTEMKWWVIWSQTRMYIQTPQSFSFSFFFSLNKQYHRYVDTFRGLVVPRTEEQPRANNILYILHRTVSEPGCVKYGGDDRDAVRYTSSKRLRLRFRMKDVTIKSFITVVYLSWIKPPIPTYLSRSLQVYLQLIS